MEGGSLRRGGVWVELDGDRVGGVSLEVGRGGSEWRKGWRRWRMEERTKTSSGWWRLTWWED